MIATNWAAAFLEFSRGSPPEEISIALAIPLKLLKAKIHGESWRRLAAEVALPAPVATVKAERDIAKIEANRAKNYEIALKLQENLIEIVDKLRKGELRV